MENATTVQLHPYTQDSPLLDDAVQIFVRTWPGYNPVTTRKSFVRYAGRRGFRGIVAIVDGAVAGFGYGVRSVPGIWWHDQMTTRLGPGHPALQDAWLLVELAVRAECRGRGIGGCLHNALLDAQPCPRALLSTHETNARARAMYARRGWYGIHPTFFFPHDAQAYVALANELASPATTESESSVPVVGGPHV